MTRISKRQSLNNLNMNYLLGILCLSQLLVTPCQARCAAPGTFREEFEAAIVVAHVYFDATASTSDLPCGFEYYDMNEGMYFIDDQDFTAYTVMEVFKQPEAESMILPGDHLSIVYMTDTGYRLELPDSLWNTTEGFVAFLQPYRYCVEFTPPDNMNTYPYPDDELYQAVAGNSSNPYLLNECALSNNKPWDSLSEEDLSFLNNYSMSSTIFEMTEDMETLSSNITTDDLYVPSTNDTNHTLIDVEAFYTNVTKKDELDVLDVVEEEKEPIEADTEEKSAEANTMAESESLPTSSTSRFLATSCQGAFIILAGMLFS